MKKTFSWLLTIFSFFIMTGPVLSTELDRDGDGLINAIDLCKTRFDEEGISYILACEGGSGDLLTVETASIINQATIDGIFCNLIWFDSDSNGTPDNCDQPESVDLLPTANTDYYGTDSATSTNKDHQEEAVHKGTSTDESARSE